MNLITKSDFLNLRDNDDHEYEVNTCGDKKVLKIFCDNTLIAKKIKLNRSIRYFAIKEDVAEISNGLLLVNMVVDIERVGDYAKNILDLAISTPKTVVAEKISEDLKAIEDEVLSRFDKTIEAVNIQDADVAKKLMATHKKMVTKIADKLVDRVLSGKLIFGNEAQAASVVLYARYLKRIASHLTNITTTLVNPLDQIGYSSS